MKKLLLTIVCIFAIFTAKAQCEYTVTGNDSWGDGWNGASIDIEVGGESYNFTVTGYTDSITISSYTGDIVTFDWVGGSYDSEITFAITEPDGSYLYELGAPPSTDGIFISDTSNSTCAPPSCTAPTSITTTNSTATSADLAWTAGDSETAWEIVVQADTTGEPTGSGTAVNTTAAYSATGLTGNTAYEVYYRADCGGDYSPWAGPFDFTTLCNSVATFSENFDGVSTGTLPTCWSKIVTSTSSFSAVETSTSYDISAPNSVRMYASSDTSATMFLVSPAVTTLGGAYRLSFNAVVTDVLCAYSIGTITDPTDAATFTAIYSNETLGAAQALYSKVYDFSAYAGTDSYVAIQYHPVYYDSLHLDDIVWEAVPSCLAPSGITYDSNVSPNPTATSASFVWTAGASETAWEIVVQADGTGTPVGSGTAVATTPAYSATGLTETTAYEVYYRADCTGGDYSAWVGPVDFTTPLAPIVPDYSNDFSTFPGTGWTATTSGWASDGFANVGTTGAAKFNIYLTGGSKWLFSPTFDLSSGGYEINLDVALTLYASTNATVIDSDDSVNVMQSIDDGTTWTTVYTWNASNSPSNTGDNVTIDVSTVTSATVKFALLALEGSTSSADMEFFADNFAVQARPASNWSGATSSAWDDASNWNEGVVPDGATDIWITSGSTNDPVIASTDAITAVNVNIDSGYTLTINSGGSLSAVNLVNNGTLTLNADKDNSASIILSGTSTGDITYTRDIDTDNWYLISSPVSGQDIDVFASNSGLATLTGTNLGLAGFNGVQNAWDYYQTGASGSGSFPLAEGYSLKLASAGDITFTGTMDVDNTVLSLTDYSGTGGSAYNLLGNPYPSYIAGDNTANATDNILTVNTALLTEETIWVWDQSNNTGAGGYTQFNHTSDYYLAPGQAFWVEASAASAVFEINTNMQSHQSTAPFYINEIVRPEINLLMTDGSLTSGADIFYIDGTTTGFDNGYDSSIFGGSSNSFAIYTQTASLISDRKLGIQSLPNSDFENMIIPVGINAVSGTEITIAATSLDLPIGIDVYLEDRDNNTLTLLDDTSRFTTILSTDLNGVGRFYLHTSSGMLNNSDVNMESIIIFKSSENNLQIAGVQNGMANLKIYDMLGKQVLETSFEGNGTNNISLPSVQNGIYIVHLETETGILNKKIIL